MSCVMSKYLSYLFGKGVGMTDREANAWAEKEAAELDLRRERAKVKWLCKTLENRDPMISAEAWEDLSEIYGVKE